MIFSPNQIEQVLRIVDKYTLTFLAKRVGTNILSATDKAILKGYGIDVSNFKESSSTVHQAFKFGMLSDALSKDAAKGMTFNGFKDYLAKGRFIPLNNTEKMMISTLQAQAASDVRNLSNRIKKNYQDDLVTITRDRRVRHSNMVLKTAQKAIEDRKSVSQLKGMLADQLAVWDRDLGRIADYVLHSAFDEGRIASYERKGGKQKLVYKDVFPGACKHCMRVYLTGSVGSQPIIFTIEELQSNGTNIGRKVAEQLAVIGPAHPNCRCTIEDCPDGMTKENLNSGVFEWKNNMFVRNKDKFERKVKRRSKVKVTVNNKTTEV